MNDTTFYPFAVLLILRSLESSMRLNEMFNVAVE
jgi:hypothetical protein